MEHNRSSAFSRRTSAIGPFGPTRPSSIAAQSSTGGNRDSLISTTNTGNNKLVLITGATGGIGCATSVAFARTGKYNLALHFHTASDEQQEKLMSAISDALPAVIDVALFQADLGKVEDVRRLHQEVVEGFGKGVDVLFNNAGTTGGVAVRGGGRRGNVQGLEEVGIEVFEQVWRVNAAAPMLLAQLCLPYMEGQGWGRMIFNSSIAALTGGVVGPHYASSKSALHGFVHWLGANVARKGVTVNAVAPALIDDTAMLGGLQSGSDDEEMKQKFADNIPIGRPGRPEEVAETVMWMVNTAYVTRKIVAIDGGYHPC